MITDDIILAIKKDAWRYTKLGIDRDEAESISMVGLCKAAQDFDSSLAVPFIAYARRVIKFHHIDELRKRTKRGKKPLYEFHRQLEDNDATYEIDEERVLLLMRVWKLIDGLSKTDQKILKMKFIYDMGNEEIGRRLNIKRGSVATMVWVAIDNLKNMVKDEHRMGFQCKILDKDSLKKCLAVSV